MINPIIPIPRSVPLIDGGLSLLALGGVRLAFRLLHEQELSGRSGKLSKRVLVVGAGESGTMIVREMLRRPDAGLKPIGYLDDEPSKQRSRILGIPVLGTIDDLPVICRRMAVDEVLIAMPSASGETVRRVVELSQQAGVKHRIIPGVFDILVGKLSIAQIREVDVEDLLRRDPVTINMDDIAAYLQDRSVLVTGAGGSIGSEIARQVTHFQPRQLLLVERDETAVYLFERELRENHPGLDLITVVADIQRKEKMAQLFEQYRPQVIFHAAALKHVPVMEHNPDQAVLNNVLGTKNLLDLALQFGVERFVNISTDKAIHPTSVMGASKRVAELLVTLASEQVESHQAYVSVRFGNVLGSRGSVVPIFREQIRRGGPVTVTHPDMTRYFMSIPEASQLVLEAAALGENGVVYLLDMGEPVKIVELAHDLIRLSALQPETDISIEYVGQRPGEKLTEELLTAEEGAEPTRHEKILVVRKNSGPADGFTPVLEELLVAASECDEAQIRLLLRELVPTYQPGVSELRT
jgi:FlaA1/EpsC-like NDP-sugar epimerase